MAIGSSWASGSWTDPAWLTGAWADVGVANQDPVAAFTYAKAGLLVLFTDLSMDSDGTIASWAWDFGDGSGTSTAQHPTYEYAGAGTYTVELTVTDDDGATDIITHDVTVAVEAANTTDRRRRAATSINL